MADIPDSLPILPVRDVVVFPYMTLPLQIVRDLSLQAVERALKEHRLVLLLTQKNAQVDTPEPEDLYAVGTVGMIVRMIKQSDDKVKVLVQGLSKAMVKEVTSQRPCLFGRVEGVKEPVLASMPLEVEALMRSVHNTLEDFLEIKNLPNEIIMLTENITDPGALADLVAANLHLKVYESQELLECVDPLSRLEKVADYLHREIHLSRMQDKISSQAKEELNKTQKEYYLREQIKAIQGELGDQDEKTDEILRFREQVQQTAMPPAVEKEALKQ